NGYVATLMGRRRALPELSSSNFQLRSFGERAALNTPIQGMAADIIKLAMVRVYTRLKEEKLSAKLILQVHDELIVEAPLAEQERAGEILKTEMEQAYLLKAPLVADMHAGLSWYEAK
ncbi:MAG: DNA polymerase I, partial [Clostridia bacterium]|nr:DNA polymerase I [Clostridia bacterium]